MPWDWDKLKDQQQKDGVTTPPKSVWVYMITIVAILIVIGVGAYLLYSGELIFNKPNNIASLSKDLREKLHILNNVQQSMTNLIEFIEDQKQRLKQSENIIKNLEEEHATIQPIVEADRKIIDSIFKIQEQKYRQQVWNNRFIGFIIGVLSSFIATVIWNIIRKR